jgi:rRNA-processing protein FCF1
VEKILGRGVRFAVPAAVLDELRSFGAAAEAAARFCSKHCEVLGAPGAAGAADAVLALLGEANERKFVVATHDDTLQARARRVPGTPLLRFTGTVLTLDAPSKASLRAAKRSERGREALDDDERALVRELKAAGARRTRSRTRRRRSRATPRRRARRRSGGRGSKAALEGHTDDASRLCVATT